MTGDTTGMKTFLAPDAANAHVLQAGDFGGKIEIGSADLLFQGAYSRLGDDLFLTSSNGNNVLVTDYFLSEAPATLVSSSGAVMPGNLVTTLAGPRTPGQYAQAGTTTSGAVKIGVVEKLTGEATATRADGSSVKLKVGDAVFKGDVVATGSGSALGITFKDGTVFNMTASARMVLNNLVYEDGGKDNAMLFSLVQGGFSFVAGKVAPTGDMKIDTPVATMGIRGTTPFVLIADNGKTTFSILPDPSGKVGLYSLFNRETGALIGTVSDTGTKFELVSATSAPLELTKTATELLEDSQTQKQLVDVFNRAQQNPFNEGAQSDQGQGEGKQEGQKEGDGEQKPGDEGSNEQNDGVPGNGITTQVAEDGGAEQAPDLGEGAGGNLNVEAGSETDTGGEIVLAAPLGETGPDETPEAPDDPVVDNPAIEPIVTLPASASVTEDGSTTISGISITDDSSNVGVTLSAQSTVTLASLTGLTFSVGDGIDDEDMAFTGSPEDVTAALDGLTYNPTGDNDVGGGVTIIVTDGTNVVISQLDVAIAPVNDLPVVTVTDPTPQNEGNAGSGSPDAVINLLAQTTIVDPDTLDQQSYVANSAAQNTGGSTGNAGALFTLDPVTGIVTYNVDDFDFLTDGESSQFTVDFQVQSGPDVVDETIIIEVLGINDQPVVTVTNPAAVNEGDVGASSPDVTLGLFAQTTIVEPDASDLQSYEAGSASVAVGAGSPTGVTTAQVTLNAATGVLTYNPDTFDFLNAGETAVFDVTFDVRSGPDVVTRTLNVQINGVNDVPVSADNTINADASNLHDFVLSDFTFTDADAGSALDHVTIISLPGAGDLTLSGSAVTAGQQIAAADISNLQYQHNFGSGAVNSSTFQFSVSDGVDDSAAFDMIINAASNVPPTVTSNDPAPVPEGDAGGSTPVVDVDVFAQTDIVDPDNSPGEQSYVVGSADFSVATGSAPGVTTALASIDDVTGIFSYNPDDFDFLTAGQSAIFEVLYSVASGPDTSAQSIFVEVTGQNDAPTVTLTNPAATLEQGAGPSSEILIDLFSTLTISDPDQGEAAAASYVANSATVAVAAGSAAGVVQTQIGVTPLGTVQFFDGAFNFLKVGEKALFDVTFDVQVGPDTVTRTAQIEVTGQNDVPTVTVTNPAATLEQGAGPSSEILIDLFSTLTISDADQGEAAAASYVANSATVAVAAGSAAGVVQTQIGVTPLGTVQFFDGAFNFLKVGDKALFDVTFDVQVGPDTVTRTAQIEVTGQNDAPTVTVNNPAPVTEGSAGATPTQILFNVFDRLVISDPDAGEAAGASYVANSASVSVGAGSAAGVNTSQVSLDPATGEFSYFDSTFDFLGAGQFAFFNIDFDSTVGPDTVSRTVQVQINGENDLPVVSAVTNPVAVPEGDTGVLSNHSFNLLATVTASDVDATDTPTVDEASVAIAVNPSSDTADFSSLAINGAGNTTRIDVDTANFDFLKNGEQAVFDVTFDVISGADTVTRTATIAITGVNDPPELDLDLNNSSGATGADFNNTFVEDAGPVRIGDLAESDLNITDRDDGFFESVTATLTNRPDGGAESLSFVGTLPSGVTLTAYNSTTGEITLTGTASKVDYEGIIENIVYENTSDGPDLADRIIQVVVNDGDDDSNIATATIAIQAVNDAPTISLPAISTPNPLLHYTFDTADVSGQTVENVVNPGVHEAASTVFTSTAGISGQGASFDVASNPNDFGVVQDDLQTVLGNGSMTVSFWTDGNYSGGVLGNYSGSGSAGISSIRYSGIFMGGGGNVPSQAIASSANVATSDYTHITYVFNVVPGSNNDTLTTYQDGVLVGTTPLIDTNGSGSQTDWSFATGAANDFALGRRFASGSQSNKEPLVGTIDELRVFDGALTASQVDDVYNSDLQFNVDEDTPLSISGIQISDVDSGNSDIEVTLAVSNGTLNVKDNVAGGLATGDISGNGSASVVLTGTLAQINATLADAAAVTYQGTANFNGIDTLTITANDQGATGSDPGLTGDANSEEAVATQDITVNAVNDPLIVSAVSNPASVPEGDTGVLSNVSFNLLSTVTATDADAGETPTVDETSVNIDVNTASDTANFSSLAINGTGNTTRIDVDTANFDFLDTGEMAVFDVTFDIISGPDTVTRTATLTFTGLNDTPSSADNTISINEDQPHTFSSGEFAFNDPDTSDNFVGIKVTSLPTGGTLRLSGAAVTTGQVIAFAVLGNLVYTPAANANGVAVDDFQFQVFDGSVFSTPKTITFDITPVGDSPTAVTDHFEGTSGDVLTGNIFANDLNPDGPPDLTTQAAVFFTEKGNKVEVTATGDVTFTPFGNFEGADNFSYLITDGQGDQDTGVASFVINPTVNGDQTLTGTTGNDQLIGASGADTLTGLGGNDILVGGGTSLDPRNLPTDIDLLDGGSGNDRLYVTESRANLIGGQGDDVLAGAPSKGDLGTDFYVADYSASTGAIKANFTPISQTVAGTLLNPNEVSDGAGGTDWVSGMSYVRDTNQDDTLLIDNGLGGGPTKVYLSGGDDTVTFSNFAANPDSQISYQFATSIDGIVGVNADLQSGTATGITSANVDAANPFITAASAPASNSSVGNDSFTGAFELAGSQFKDQLFGDANDNFLFGHGGDDYIDGRGGSNTAGYFFAAAGVNVDLSINMAIADGDGGQDQLVNISKVAGSLHDDTIVGDTQINQLFGLAGDDNISGGAGNDVINGGGLGNPDIFDGNDTLYGDAGLDTILGGTGDDDIFGGDDNDFLDGGKGNDLIDGGAGNDQILTGGTPLDTYSNFFGRGDLVYGGTGDDQIFSQGGFALIDGGQGNDTITDTGTGANEDWANVTYKSSPAAIQANLSSTARTVGGTALGAFEVADGFGTVDNVQRMHVIRDSAFDDTIFVDDTYDNSFSSVGFRFFEVRLSGGDDTVTFQNFGTSTGSRISYENSGSIDDIIGVNGDLATQTATGLTQGLIDANNTLFTTSVTTNITVGNDTFSGANMLRGSKFNDQLFGSNASHEERLRGSQGDDFIDGRGGIDAVDYGNSVSGATVDLFNGVATNDGFGDQDQLLNIENIRGSVFDDTLTGDNNANQIRGNSGNDTIFGLDGADDLRGGSGSDFIEGGDGNDTLRGEGAPDDVTANGDFLDGGAGDDNLTSANGFSVLRGGAGNDTLTVSSSGTVLWNDFSIADYSTSTGNVAANLTPFARTLDGTFLQGFEIADGLGGIDTMTNTQATNVIRDGSGDDIFVVDGAFANNFGNWIEVRLSAGDDDVTFSGVSAARLSYRNAASADGTTGVHIDAVSGTATGLNATLIDPSNTLFTTSLSTNTSIGFDTFTGANRYRGSEFNDQIIGTSADERFRGDGGNDFINGGGGTDRLTFASSTSGINVDLENGIVSDDGKGGTDQVLNIEDVRGSIFDDTISGDSGNNRLWGAAGDDTLIGLAGNDELYGDGSDPNSDGGFGGNDVLEGGDGNDRLEGGVGDDILRGGDQTDFLIGGEGDDFIDGGDDFLVGGLGIRGFFDHVSYASSPNGVNVDLQHGFASDGFGTADVLVGIEVVTGSAQDDTLLGGNPNNDGFEDFRPGNGTDTIDGGSGFDRLRYADAPTGIVANFSNTTQFGAAAGTVLDGFGKIDTVSNIESIQGSAFGDILIGDDNGFQFRGREGNDIIIGGAGIDEADYAFSGGPQGIVANLNNSTDQVTDTFGNIDQLTSIENIRGSFLGDSIIGDTNDNRFTGLSGNDSIDGFGGHDIIDYNRGFNNILDNNGAVPSGVNVDLFAGTATDPNGDTDTLAGIEEVIGTILADTIAGDPFDNIIESRSGADTLTGGGGADRFTTIAGDVGVDTITDFNPLDDKLDISGLLDASFTPATSSDFVQAVDNSGDTTVSVDADGTANGVNFVDIATLQGVGIGSTLTYVYDDADNTTTVTVV